MSKTLTNDKHSYLTRGEAAAILGCHYNTVKNYELRGRLRRFNDCHGWALYLLDEIIALRDELLRVRDD